MDGVVYLADDGRFYVSLRVLEMEVDVAGPFDDETDATFAARRSVYGGGKVVTQVAGHRSDYAGGATLPHVQALWAGESL